MPSLSRRLTLRVYSQKGVGVSLYLCEASTKTLIRTRTHAVTQIQKVGHSFIENPATAVELQQELQQAQARLSVLKVHTGQQAAEINKLQVHVHIDIDVDVDADMDMDIDIDMS